MKTKEQLKKMSISELKEEREKYEKYDAVLVAIIQYKKNFECDKDE